MDNRKPKTEVKEGLVALTGLALGAAAFVAGADKIARNLQSLKKGK